MSLNKSAFNLRFLTAGRGSLNGLAGYLQGIFGQCVGVVRKMGQATVLAASTSIVVADSGVVAGDIVTASVATQGATAGTFVTGVSIIAGTSFTISVNQAPGTGGAVINYAVHRSVP